MPYISTEEVKEIRSKIKQEFKDFKFSIVRDNFSCVAISILSSSYDFGVDYKQVNEFWIDENYKDKPEQARFLKRLIEICKETKEQVIVNANSDYGDWPNYYISLSIGRWDRAYCLGG